MLCTIWVYNKTSQPTLRVQKTVKREAEDKCVGGRSTMFNLFIAMRHLEGTQTRGETAVWEYLSLIGQVICRC